MAKVLVAEDDSLLSRFLVDSLQDENQDTQAAFDGVQAMEQIGSWHPNLVLLDLLMPTMDGFAVLEEMSKDGGMAKIPVVVLTNVASKEDIDRVKKYPNVAHYVVKIDITPKILAAKISSMLA